MSHGQSFQWTCAEMEIDKRKEDRIQINKNSHKSYFFFSLDWFFLYTTSKVKKWRGCLKKWPFYSVSYGEIFKVEIVFSNYFINDISVSDTHSWKKMPSFFYYYHINFHSKWKTVKLKTPLKNMNVPYCLPATIIFTIIVSNCTSIIQHALLSI